MPIEYDLVVIGASEVGLEAAQIAARYGARVALVQQGAIETAPIAHRAFQRAVRQIRHLDSGSNQPFDRASSASLEAQWAWIQRVVQTEIDDYCDRRGADSLEMQGIEVIPGLGQFDRTPKLGWRVDDRVLRSRAFLLALQQPQPTPSELAATVSCNLGDLLKQHPKQVAILGGQAPDLELALALHHLGVQTTLVTADSILLPQADREFAFRLQSYCEALGLTVLTDSPLQQTKQLDDQTWLQVGHRAIATEAVISSHPPSAPNWAALNLEAFRLKRPIAHPTSGRIERSNLYIAPDCGRSPNSHPYSMALNLVQHILLPFWQHSRPDPWGSIGQFPQSRHRSIPPLKPPLQHPPAGQYQISSSISMAGVGLTEQQARDRYGRDVVVVRGELESGSLPFPLAHGHCKLISRRNGTLLGGHAIGTGAIELVEQLAWAHHQRLKLPQLLGRIGLPHTQTAPLQRLIEQWHHQRRSPLGRELLLDWFAWQRSRWH